MTVAPLPTGAATATDWLARIERFDVVGSTNDIVVGWLAEGAAEVCVAVASEQTAGRGRSGRSWMAPRDAALLCSVGFTPIFTDPERLWQWSAIVSLAMADAVEAVAGRVSGTVRLKWPNDLVVVDDGQVRKLAGVLGETSGAGTEDQRVVVGIGVNAGWPRSAFPPQLADSMTSVAELAPAGAAAWDPGELRDALLERFIDRLRPAVTELHSSRFPAAEWRTRQLTSGSTVRLEWPDGTVEAVMADDVDPESGALLVRPVDASGPARAVLVGEIRHLRVGGAA